MIDLIALKREAAAGAGNTVTTVSRRWLDEVARELEAHRRDAARGAICEGLPA